MSELSASLINESLCDDEFVTVGSQIFDIDIPSGSVLLVNALGCDSIVTVDLQYGNIVESSVNRSICEGESFDFGNGVILNETSPNQSITLTSALGCDSIVHYSLDIKQNGFATIYPEVCQDESVLIHGQVFNQNRTSGQIDLTTAEGCDSVLNVELIVHERSEVVIDRLMCAGQSLDIGAVSFTENYSGTIRLFGANQNGCDSFVHITVSFHTVIPGLAIDREICRGEEVNVRGEVFNEDRLSGQFTLDGLDDCDTLITVNLSIAQDISSEVNDEICQGGFREVNGQRFDANNLSGQVLLTAANGCDSTVFINLTIAEQISSVYSEEICAGNFVDLHGERFDADRLTGQIDLTTVDGCDSTLFVNLSLAVKKLSNYSETICEGDFTDIHGQRFDASHLAGEVLLTTLDGCDSTVNVNVQLAPHYEIVIDTAACASDFGGAVNSSDILSDTLYLVSSFGCDSVYIVNMSFIQTTYSLFEATLCADEIVELGSESFDINSPFGSVVFTSTYGCDSIVNVDLTYITTKEETLTSIMCEGEELVVNNVTYDIDNPVGLEIMSLSNGCDSIVMVDLQFVEHSRTLIDDIMCAGESMMLNGVLYDEDSPFGNQTLSASSGCDSIIDVNLNFAQPASTFVADNLCVDEEMSIGGIIFDVNNQSGEIVLSTFQGCDSTVTVDLTFTDLQLDIVGRAECPDVAQGGSIEISSIQNGLAPYTYSINGQVGAPVNGFPMNISGLLPANYTIEVVDAEGCAYTQNITIKDSERMDINIDHIETGEGTYDLELQHTGIIDSFQWISPVELSCNQCLRPSIDINSTVIIQAEVFDVNGCTRTVALEIDYVRGVEYEIANVIHPGSVVNNERAYLTVAEPENLLYDMYVYSRWGDQIFKDTDLLVNDPNTGWDGTKAGRKLNTGVYIYKIMIKENDTILDIIHGDITLID